MRFSNRKIPLGNLFKIAVSIVLLGVVFTRTGWRNIASVLTVAHIVWLALALVVYILGVLVRSVRWAVLLRGLGISTLSIWRLTALYFVSFFFNSFLPTGIGGDVVRVAEVARTAGASMAASSVIADRAVGLAATSLLALAALPFAGIGLNPVLAWVAGLAVAGPAVAFWVLRWAGRTGLDSMGTRWPFLRRFTDHRKVRKATGALAASPLHNLLLAIGVSLGFAASNVLSYACIGEAVNIHLPLAYYMLASPIITLVLLLPISFNGLGTRDVAYQALFVPLGVSPEGALAMSLVYHALNLLTAMMGGGIYAAMGAAETLATGDKTP